MKEIAVRRPGRSRLVYNKTEKTIDVIDRSGLVDKKVGVALHVTNVDADLI